MNKLELQKTANEIRKGIVSGVHAAKAGHPGACGFYLLLVLILLRLVVIFSKYTY